jgi:hypothetical protein
MKFLKNYRLFEEAETTSEVNTDLKNDISEMIKKSLNTEDEETFNKFLKSFIRNPEESQIQGLINDSDVYEFYLKYRNDIDELLSKVNFYDEVPSEMSTFSLYDYIIKGTKRAVSEIISDLSESGSSEKEAQ